jgi:hypothetical protein
LDGVEARVARDDSLTVRLLDGVSRAGTMAEVLRLAEAAQLALQNVQSSENETEDVYLRLLQEDEAHGFQRFHLDAESGDDALRGDSPA